MAVVAALPIPRSSHDVAIVDGKLYVIGGWSMRGEDGEDWLNKTLVLDLKAAQPKWEEIEQPFQRRALIVTVHDGKIFVIGGFNEDNVPERRVDVYDPRRRPGRPWPNCPGKITTASLLRPARYADTCMPVSLTVHCYGLTQRAINGTWSRSSSCASCIA